MRYSVAVLTIAPALVLTAVFAGLLTPMRLLFLWAAVLISALLGGTRAGLLATVLAVLGALFLVFAPNGAFALVSAQDVVRLTLFGIFAGDPDSSARRAPALVRGQSLAGASGGRPDQRMGRDHRRHP